MVTRDDHRPRPRSRPLRTPLGDAIGHSWVPMGLVLIHEIHTLAASVAAQANRAGYDILRGRTPVIRHNITTIYISFRDPGHTCLSCDRLQLPTMAGEAGRTLAAFDDFAAVRSNLPVALHGLQWEHPGARDEATCAPDD